jgi:integrase/recombinase XerD
VGKMSKSKIAIENLPPILKQYASSLNNLSPRTVRTYLYAARALHDCLSKKERSVESLTKQDVAEFFNDFTHEKKLRKAYVANRARSIRSLTTWLWEEEKISEREYRKIKKYLKRFNPSRDEVETNRVALDDSEIKQVFKKLLDPILYFLFWFGLNTGARRLEIINLKLSDFDGQRVIIREGKGNKSRAIPMTKRQARILARLIEWRKSFDLPHEYVFFNSRGEKLSEHTILYRMKKISIITGVHIYCHKLRYTFAVKLWKNGVDIVLIQKVLGHVTIQQTIDYLKIEQEELLGRYLRDVEEIEERLGGDFFGS